MMNEHDVVSWWLPAARRLTPVYTDGGFNDHQSGMALDRALGIREFGNYCYRTKSQDRPMPDGDLKTLIKNLAGPYGKAILKAYQIKRGINASKENSDNLQNQDHQEASQA